MGDKSTIEWCDATWNPTTGCTRVSPGCKNCYIERTPPFRMKGRKFESGTTGVILHPDRLDAPLHWRKPRRIFVNSLSDLFHEDVPDEFIGKVFSVMRSATHHTFQILTKRPARMHDWIKRCANGGGLGWITHDGTEPANAYAGTGIIVGDSDRWPLPNVWLGVSVEDQKTADERIPLLLQTPAEVRFISAEPLLGPIDLGLDAIEGDVWYHNPAQSHPCDYACNGFAINGGLDWIISGGESGPGARPMHPDWARSIRDQCQAAEVAYFFKQWGEWLPDNKGIYRDTDSAILGDVVVHRLGKKKAGRLLDGREWMEFPR